MVTLTEEILDGKLHFLCSDITSDYEFLLQMVNIFTINTDEYSSRCYKVNDAKTFKKLLYYFMLCAHKSYDAFWRLARLTGVFKNIDLVLWIIESD